MSELNQLPAHLIAPPDTLSERSREFFDHVIATGMYDAPARTLLIEFCVVSDRLDAVRAELATAGRYFQDKHGQPRQHPLTKEELSLVNEKGKIFRLLGWDQAPPEGGQLTFSFGRRNAAD